MYILFYASIRLEFDLFFSTHNQQIDSLFLFWASMFVHQ